MELENKEAYSTACQLKNEFVWQRLKEIAHPDYSGPQPPAGWFGAQNGDSLLLEPLVTSSGVGLPLEDKLGLAWLRETQNEPAPLGAEGSMFQEMRVLMLNKRRGKRSVPRNRTSTDPLVELKKDRLRAATTEVELRALLKTRAKEIRNSNVAGSDGEKPRPAPHVS